MQFFAVLNVFLDGDAELSKNAMTEFLSNFSMQALPKTNNSI